MSRQYHFILHIGTEKTGTTTLQHLLSFNSDRLQEAGFFYWVTPGRIEARSIAAAATDDKQPDDYLKSIEVETPEDKQAFREATVRYIEETLEALPLHVHTVIISSEHLHSRLRKRSQLEWIKQILVAYAKGFTVVCYLRRQADLAESYYSTMLKNGEIRPLGKIAELTCQPGNHYYNYETLLTLWASCFGEESIVARIFDSSLLKSGDIVSDFLDISGITGPLVHPGNSGRRYNESLIPLGQGLLRGINQLRKECGNEEPVRDACKALSLRVIQAFPGRGERLAQQDVERIEQMFEDSNEKVRSLLFSERVRLFEPRKRQLNNSIKQSAPLEPGQLEVIEETINLLERDPSKPIKPLDSCAELLRDLAVHYEKQDKQLSWRMMTLARRIRPKGPFIQKKCREYEEACRGPLYRLKKHFGLA